jgi:flagellar basal body-associated protein FliL
MNGSEELAEFKIIPASDKNAAGSSESTNSSFPAWAIITIIVMGVIIIGGGVAVYFLFIKKKPQ